MKICYTPVGTVSNKVKHRRDMPLEGVLSVIRIRKAYKKALFRIADYPYLWILCYPHLADRKVLRVRKRKFRDKGKLRGVFAMHSPDRPNPLAMTRVRLVSVRGCVLKVEGLDMIDGTPVLDIKSVQDG